MSYSSLSLQLPSQHPVSLFVGHDCIQDAFSQCSLDAKHIFIITQETILNSIAHSIQHIIAQYSTADIHIITVPDGETAKSMTSYSQCMDQLFAIGVERSDIIVGCGGGVVTDLAGFIASSCLRGLRLIQVPTTLLAQVDAAIGGKTGINHVSGKNLIGAFYQPRSIIIDIYTLCSLNKRECVSGFAEVIKYGIIGDSEFFEHLVTDAALIKSFDFKRHHHIWTPLIKRACQNKLSVVQDDEKESSRRAILNFGHTIGHGIEALFDYDTYKHGECVAFGMVAATHIALKKQRITSQTASAIYDGLRAYDYHKISLSPIDINQLMPIIKRDKKVKQDTLRFILPTAIGAVEITDDVTIEDIDEAVDSLYSFFNGG